MFDMTVLTVLMLVAVLCFAPLKISVNFFVDVNTKTCFVKIKLFFVSVMKEKMELSGKYLVCSGTVNEKVDLFASRAANINAAFCLDELQLIFVTNSQCSAWNMLVSEVFAAAVAVVCCANNCKVHTQTVFGTEHAVWGKAKFSVSLAEIIAALLKNSSKKPSQQSSGR